MSASRDLGPESEPGEEVVPLTSDFHEILLAGKARLDGVQLIGADVHQLDLGVERLIERREHLDIAQSESECIAADQRRERRERQKRLAVHLGPSVCCVPRTQNERRMIPRLRGFPAHDSKFPQYTV